MKNTIDSITRRTQRYWYVDGLAEITVGLLFVILCGYFLAQARINSLSFNHILANGVLLAALLLVVWLLREGLFAVKTRLTYPRTGYVAFPRQQHAPFWQRYGLAAFVAMLSVAAAVVASHSQAVPAWEPFFAGIISGLAALAIAFRFRLLRLALLGCAMVVVGAAVAYLHPGEPLGWMLFSSINGLCFILSGAVTLVSYLRSTQKPVDENL